MARWHSPGMDINEMILKLCHRHGVEVTLHHIKSWVAYMERQQEIIANYCDDKVDGQ